MSTEATTKANRVQNSFMDALRSEIVAGNEHLSEWVRQVQDRGAIESLFGMETWLKGIRSFLNLEHLQLAEADKSSLVTRSFAPEIGIVHQAIQHCEKHACNLLNPGLEPNFDDFIDAQMRRDRIFDYNISRIAEQLTPTDSITQLLESLNDLRITIDSLKLNSGREFQLFVVLGRNFNREIKNCRYVDMLLSQRFKLQYDLVDNKALTATLRRIPQEVVRRNVVTVFLYLFRFLKYLELIAADLKRDRPLKHNLVIFSLIHEEIGNLVDFMRVRILKNAQVGNALEKASELISYSMKTDSHRVQNQELINVSHERDPRAVYSRIENSHGLLRNCCQSSIMALIQSIDKNCDPSGLFPSSAGRLGEAEKLRQDLWALRRWLMDVLADREMLDSARIIERLGLFKDASLHSLMFRDWAEFESFSDALLISVNLAESHTHIRKFVTYLEKLVQEVSKRSVFRENANQP